MITCVTKKKVYQTMDVAEDALIDAWIKFDYAPNQGPIAIYRCDDCGYFHFTSKGIMNEKLAKYQTDGKIKLQKRANAWHDKIKKRK